MTINKNIWKKKRTHRVRSAPGKSTQSHLNVLDFYHVCKVPFAMWGIIFQGFEDGDVGIFGGVTVICPSWRFYTLITHLTNQFVNNTIKQNPSYLCLERCIFLPWIQYLCPQHFTVPSLTAVFVADGDSGSVYIPTLVGMLFSWAA